MPRLHVMEAVRRDWELDRLLIDLRNEEWEASTPPGWLERAAYIGSYEDMAELAKAATPEGEWDKAFEEDDLVEIIDEYLYALADYVNTGVVDEVNPFVDAHDVYLVQKRKDNTPGVLDWSPE